MPRAGFRLPEGGSRAHPGGVGSGGWRGRDMSEDPGGASRGRHDSGGEAADDAPTPPSGTPSPSASTPTGSTSGESSSAGSTSTGSAPTEATDQPWWNADA